ncbi:Fatty-acid amide hydrolase 2-A [Goodea atripinnis]|uniref:Fatty-acid amide hydrolase 2-A n=1 Tax=Goodea atripinnis TaxID=208336 RepID=A0ABV0PWH7_9TELE
MALNRLEKAQTWLFRAVTAFFFMIFQFFSPRRPADSVKKLPPVTNPLLLQSATQLAKKIRRKEVCTQLSQADPDATLCLQLFLQQCPKAGFNLDSLIVSSVEVVQAYIDRIQDVNPFVNAVVKDRFAAALQEAALVDKLIEEETGGEEVLEDRLPLLGVPLSVKESYSLQGMPLTTGLMSRRGVVASVDAPPVALLKRSGAIPLGVTNTSELCMWLESHNHLYGITCNAYDLERIPGGSSGGEGSILGAAGAVIGVGSDIGGSIRMPCFFNGIFGHKTTPGVVSSENQYPPTSGRQDEYLSCGPMCRYAEDLLPMLKIMAGPNAHMLSLNTDVNLKKLRFFSIPHDGGSAYTYPVSKELLDIQKKVVERLEADLGVKVQQVCLRELRYSFQIWDTYMGLPDHEGKVCPFDGAE